MSDMDLGLNNLSFLPTKEVKKGEKMKVIEKVKVAREKPPSQEMLDERESLLKSIVLRGEDVTAGYLRQIAKFPLLSHQEEVELARRIREEKNEEAIDKLVRHNLRLPVYLARRFLGRGLDFADLIQEGNLGLIKAAQGFDERLGVKFSSYAWWWIRQAIYRGIQDKGSVVRKPAHLYEKRRRFLRVQKEMERTLERAPTTLELANALGSSVHKVETFLLMEYGKAVSLDERVSGEDGRERHEFQADTASMDPRTFLLAKLELEKSCLQVTKQGEALSLLTDEKPIEKRNLQVFRMRYGLDGSFETKTLNEVASQIGLTRERVRQICSGVLKELNQKGLVIDTDGIAFLVNRIRELEGLVGQTTKS